MIQYLSTKREAFVVSVRTAPARAQQARVLAPRALFAAMSEELAAAPAEEVLEEASSHSDAAPPPARRVWRASAD